MNVCSSIVMNVCSSVRSLPDVCCEQLALDVCREHVFAFDVRRYCEHVTCLHLMCDACLAVVVSTCLAHAFGCTIVLSLACVTSSLVRLLLSPACVISSLLHRLDSSERLHAIGVVEVPPLLLGALPRCRRNAAEEERRKKKTGQRRQ